MRDFLPLNRVRIQFLSYFITNTKILRLSTLSRSNSMSAAVKWLSNRRLIEVAGAEASTFLQGLLTNDINLLKRNAIIYSFILNVKGRIVHDVFVYSRSTDNYLIEVDQKACNNLEKMLKVYRLRRKIDISAIKLDVGFTLGPVDDSFDDPRVPQFGRRAIGQFSGDSNNDKEYLMRRLEWGIAEGPDELADQIPLNANGDIMNSINFDKGCYVGQELVARTHHTGVVRRRILPFKSAEPVSGQVVGEDGRKQGRIVKSVDDRGLALVPIKSINSKLFVENIPINVYRPTWWPESIG